MFEPRALERLIADGYVVRASARCHPSPRWHAAVARAASALHQSGADDSDLRIPVAWALSAAYAQLSDHELADLIEVMLPMTAVGLPT